MQANQLPPEEAIDKELRERSLYHFIRGAWHVVEPSDTFVDNWHIEAVAKHLEAVTRGQIRNLVINMPPRHTKSLLVSVFWPAWEWISNPHRRWLYSSYSSQLSIRDSIKCRRLVESAWYRSQWGDRFYLTSDSNTTRKFDNNHSGYRLATSVGGSATGEGGDRVICDDPHNVQEAESANVREATLDWWDQVMSTRLNDPKTGAKILIAQRCHESDLSGHVLRQGGYEHLCLPAEYEQPRPATCIGWRDPRVEPGELLCPQRFGPKEIAELKLRLGSYATAGQLQQRPSPAEGGIFKRDWWKYYEKSPGEQAKLCDYLFQSWDMAFKDLKDSDYVVGQVWGVKGANRYLIDQVRERMDFVRSCAGIVTMTARWPDAKRKLVEDKANGTAVISALRSQIPGMVAVEPEGGKEARAFAVTPECEAGNVYLPSPMYASWIDSWIEELAAFPAAPNDDQVDAMTQALIHANKTKPPGKVVIEQLTRESPWHDHYASEEDARW
jgi:predicted phage terminase large subunit-like protein